ncbi:MAG: EAL domain-containing protein [Acetobacter sp.]|nr:EAL domain-containing protein [Acetobacter sp.]
MAVNVSTIYLGQSVLPELVRTTLAETKLHPNRLNIEITETALLRYKAESIQALHALHDIGVFSLDDFGTGFTSLSHFMFFPFDKIKIDKSFDKKVRNVTNDCAAIIRTVAKLSKALDARTVAEGVETQTHCDLIKADSYSLG